MRASVTLAAAGLAVACLAFGPQRATPARVPVTARLYKAELRPDSLQFRLPYGWIIPGSVVATVGAETLRAGSDYELEPAEGVFRLVWPRPSGQLSVHYQVIPLAIGRVFQQTIPFDTVGTTEVRVAPRQEAVREAVSRPRLDIRGTKTVSLEIGSAQDLTLRQSLDVALSGEIVPGVTVRGVLSDRETPLQPEGKTTELSDVDRVCLEIEGPGAGLTLGDFAFRGPPGLFTGYERRLEGISLRGRRGDARASVGAATVPGEYTTVEFLAVEGKQGPYVLLVNTGSLEGVIQAGSERVWVDGNPLVRGEDRDYTIDYAAGTLSFTGRQVVGKDSRVTVDFQTNANPYRRTAYTAQVGYGGAGVPDGKTTGGALHLQASLIVERDDPSQPVGGALSDEDRDALEAAGDSLTTELSPGIDCGGDGYGDYEWAEADSLPFRFLRYAGPDSGSCRVRFEDVGQGEGDYADSLVADTLRIYHFVGYQRGRYAPGRAIARPAERDLVGFLAAWSGPSGLRLEAEGAGSFDDPNIRSGKDDSDREGGALRLHLSRETLPVQLGRLPLGRWGFRVDSRDQEETFRPTGRVDPGWYGYEWGIAEGRLGQGDHRRSAAVRQEPGAGFAWEGSFETLSNRRDLEGERSRITLSRAGRLRGNIERTRVKTTDTAGGTKTDGERAVDGCLVGLQLQWLESAIGLRRERQEDLTEGTRHGTGFDEWRVSGAYLIRRDQGRIEVGYTDREDCEIQVSGWGRGDRARTWETRAAWTPGGRLLDGRYARRDLLRTAGGPVRTDVASLIWSEDGRDGRFGQQLRAELNTTEQEARIKSIEYAGPGQGHYDSLGVYVGVGDYDVVLLPTGESGLLRRFDATWRIEASPGSGRVTEGGSLAARLWQSSRWLFQAGFSSRTTGSASAFWRDFSQLILARRQGVPLASHRIRVEASALPRARWLSPQASFERERSEARGYENVQTGRLQDQVALTFRSSAGKAWTIEQEAQLDRQEEWTSLLGSQPVNGRQGWRSGRLRFGEAWRPVPRLSLRLGAIGRLRERIAAGSRYQVYQLIPGVQWLPGDRSRLDLQITRTWVNGPSGKLLGLERAGWEGRGSLGVRLRRWLDVSLVSDFSAPTAGTSRVNGRAEVKAIF